MRIEPAHISQIRLGEDGSVYEISEDVGNVAADLRLIDAGLKVRFAVRGKCWIVFHEHHGDCPHNGTEGPGSTYLVTSVNAHQTRSGVWTGLDQRLVDRIREIQPGGRSGHDFAKALERSYNDRLERKRKERAELFGEMAEAGAHAIRKDLGERYKGRAFINHKPGLAA